MCGEKNVPVTALISVIGSPPRVRGKETPSERPFRPCRITPACAGKRVKIIVLYCLSTDHPRVCGEKDNDLMDDSDVPGSPPRVRGKVTAVGVFCLLDGITPAYAGKSFLHC